MWCLKGSIISEVHHVVLNSYVTTMWLRYNYFSLSYIIDNIIDNIIDINILKDK